jgi:ATP synthase subunit 6
MIFDINLCLNQALEQFELSILYSIKWVGLDYYFFITNLNLIIFFEILFIFVIFVIVMKTSDVFFLTSFFILGKQICNFIFGIVLGQIGRRGLFYFPIILNFFIIILFSNIIGLIPYNFCITSQIFITFTFSFSVFFSMFILSVIYQKLDFIWFFVPKNVPIALIPFLVCIEVISYISRVFSLSIRLFANMVAGHALLHVISGSIVFGFKKIVSINVILSIIVIIPLFILVAIIGLEIGIAFLQAYVFAVLSSIYLNDMYGGAH